MSAYFKYGNDWNITNLSGIFNGVYSGVANAGFIGDVCGTNYAKPSLKADDYRADLMRLIYIIDLRTTKINCILKYMMKQIMSQEQVSF